MSGRWDDAGGIVTPEAVQLQFAEANVGSRAVAWFIDAIALGLILLVVNLLIAMLGAEAPIPEWVGITVLVVVNFLLFFGYPIGFETLLGGRTPGKAALGLRVVTVEGAPVRLRHAAIRAALGLIDFFATSGVAAVLTTLLTRRHQRLGDLVAGTVVLRERSAAPPPRVTTFEVPPGAEGYAATLDPTGLSVRDYEAVREFLLRASTLREPARGDIARRLADAIAGKLQHTRPDNVSTELFLACVAARYQARVRVTPTAAPTAATAVGQTPPVPASPGQPPASQPDDFAPPR